jgi:hypothetical protein
VNVTGPNAKGEKTMNRVQRLYVSRLLIAVTMVLTGISCWTVTDKMNQAAGGDLVVKAEASRA